MYPSIPDKIIIQDRPEYPQVIVYPFYRYQAYALFLKMAGSGPHYNPHSPHTWQDVDGMYTPVIAKEGSYWINDMVKTSSGYIYGYRYTTPKPYLPSQNMYVVAWAIRSHTESGVFYPLATWTSSRSTI